MTIKVLVVDDSALIRQLLAQIIDSAPGLQLVGAAPDAYVAKKMVMEHTPDVITLDIEMPKVNGLRFLEVLMQARPTPVLMISTLTQDGAEATMRSLELGAIDFIPKPKLGVAQGIQDYSDMIIDKIQTVARARVRKPRQQPVMSTARVQFSGTEKILAIGASTGGTEAIKQVLSGLPGNAPATVITQHMPPGYTTTFARRLDAANAMQVREARGGERLLPGCAYLAPGDKHMIVERSGADYRIRLDDGMRVTGHKPSVDKLFESLVSAAGSNVVATLLTGMGKDGAEGMLKLKQAGASTFCQDKDSCVVFGMPKAAIDIGAADNVVSLDKMAGKLIDEFVRIGAGSRL
ncbi:MAG: chemotaxis response regulator protein-glutamate methylesterase [Pseudomonadota bacterium]|jgi:two-component system chemotaxis response regulator CheB|nr:chemotaxis response regulator protein-glutamate methylesterase [Alteromonadaceae bacterium]MCP4865528.1 chemotaxis response regulator protein-glutamate methylesterase [Alteromonas sp.]MDY6925516.1 chemotaxis response regulator protein-glutamate methylesterase [Pseudomonadota bacterium]RPH18543.1 MAG: chemotaxis response regulator protein-glutamate methylesterase [Alteromonadaceae bacterium TMED7]|tara:strand:- start:12304 stop:13350 length:1047 start_codon:yes stop_codon:yes gene_type:complete